MTEGLASLLADCSEVTIPYAHASQERETLTGSHNSSVSGELRQVLPKPRAAVGIMVFSSACKLLYANQTAYEFLKMLNRWDNGHATAGALPVSVADLFDQMRLSLARRVTSRVTNGDGEQLEARRVLVGQDQAVLLRAFGLLDRLGMRGSRVVMTMQGGIASFDDNSSDVNPASI